VPSFAKYHKRKRKLWNKPHDYKQHQLKMEALNLELSETFKHGQLKETIEKQEEEIVIEKGKLLDSLDLNTGFEALQKQKEVSIVRMPTIRRKRPVDYSPPIVGRKVKAKEKLKEVNENDLRDSLEEVDFSRETKVKFILL